MATTIQIHEKVLQSLKDLRENPRQTYNDLLLNLIALHKYAKKHDQYDKFLHTIQQEKMKELWDNKEDEKWNSV